MNCLCTIRTLSLKKYEPYRSSALPDKKLVILACMDTRLTELLPKALGIKNGDVKLIKHAGAIVSHPFGSIMRNILLAVYDLDAEEVLIIGHRGCGMDSLDATNILPKMIKRGVSVQTLHTLSYAGVHLEQWLQGFSSVEKSVAQSVNAIKEHPLFPANLPVHGLIIHPETGELEVVVSDYEAV